MRLRSHRRGFTLIEIMIVVAIIGAMAALGAANLRQQQTRSRFRSSVRDMVGLVREARTNATALAGGLVTRGSIQNDNCPNWMQDTPGMSIDTTTGQIVMIDRVETEELATGACRTIAGVNRCVLSGDPCGAVGYTAACPRFVEYTISCRVEDFGERYGDISGVADMFVAADALATFAAPSSATDVRIGFDGRGQLVTRALAAPVGRITIAETTAVPNRARLTVLVNDGGSVCIEGALNQCARTQ